MGELIAALVVLLVPVLDRCDALAAADVVRAHAWRTGDTETLRDVYAAAAGEADVARLRTWRDRGIELRDVRTVRASCHETVEGVEVVERLGPLVAVLPDGSTRALPASGWDRRRIALAYAGRWRIASVESLRLGP